MPVNPAVTLRITEIFHSLQGEASTVGRPTVFIRLTGCPLRCQYCDTAYAFEGGSMRKLEEILAEVERLDCQLITVTGGEPLAQPNCILLLQLLCDEGYQVSLETSGALSVEKVDPRVSIVLDLKTPGSREADRNDLGNLSLIAIIRTTFGPKRSCWSGILPRELERYCFLRRLGNRIQPNWQNGYLRITCP
jgi:7-carboxy-7-deazaguanine synthase